MDEQDTTTPKITRPELSRRGSLTADEINTVFRVVKAHEQFPQGAFPWLWSPITASALVLPGGAPKPLRPPDRRRRRHG